MITTGFKPCLSVRNNKLIRFACSGLFSNWRFRVGHVRVCACVLMCVCARACIVSVTACHCVRVMTLICTVLPVYPFCGFTQV